MAAVLKLSAERAGIDFGFPPPHSGRTVIDGDGILWTWRDEHSGLSGRLGDWTATVPKVAALGGAGLATIGPLAGFAAGGPIGAVIGLIAGLVSGIFGQHAAKVAQENKVSGQWAATGPQAISSIVSGWQSGQVSGSDASTALDQVYAAFLQNNQSITKYKGQQGAYPDPNQPRPSQDCNWACGTSYDLYQEIQGLKGQISVGDPTGLGAGFSLSSPVVLIGLAAVAFLLLRK